MVEPVASSEVFALDIGGCPWRSSQPMPSHHSAARPIHHGSMVGER
jgi:hypothetical protein